MLLSILSIVFVNSISTPSADAQVCTGVTTTVSTAAQLDQAITCYNTAIASGAYQITLTGDIDYAGRGATPITQSAPGFSLRIEGANFTISGDGIDPLGLSDGVIIAEPGAQEVTLNQTTVKATAAVGVRVANVATVISNSTIDGNGSTANGVEVIDGSLRVLNSTVTNTTGSGIRVFDGVVSIRDSASISNGDAGLTVTGGSVALTNATISNSDRGIVISDPVGSAIVRVTSSTIAATASGGIVAAPGTVVVNSSVVTNDCASLFGPIQGEDNFTFSANSCGSSLALQGSPLPAALDNGCALPTPSGCVATVALPSDSNAVDAGPACANGLATDQRGAGFPRLNGSQCDAGAFETTQIDQCPAIGISPIVMTTTAFDEAIACYNNAVTPDAYTITLGADLAYAGRGAEPISQSAPGFSLTIEGALKAISGTGEAVGAGPQGVVVALPGAQLVTINQTGVRASGPTGAGIAAQNLALTLTNSAIDGAATEVVGLYASNGSRVNVLNSLITNVSSGIEVSGATEVVTLFNTTVSGTTDHGIIITGTSSIAINNSTVTNTSDGHNLYIEDGAASVINSTLSKSSRRSVRVLPSASGPVVANSTIIENGCFGTVVGANNFTSVDRPCGLSQLLTGSPLPAAADNGCASATPTGCVATVALPTNSNAVDAGPDCANGAVADQRGAGFSRQLGARCDAGSFESTGCVNDLFVCSTPVGPGQLPQVTAGSSLLATQEAGEPQASCATNPPADSIWFSWTAPVSQAIRVNTAGSGYDTVLSAWTGPSVASLTEVACNDDDSPLLTSELTMLVDAGVEYHFQVHGFSPDQEGPVSVAVSACGPTFADVPSTVFFANPVQLAACEGITTGTSPTTFSPSNVVTRAEWATFLWRFAGEPTGFSHSFTDVVAGAFYEDAVAWMATTGITTGTSATTYSPNLEVNRAQIATFLWRFDGQPTGFTHNFSDVVPGSFYENAVAWMSATGITTGTSPTTFAPNRPLTRAEAVTFLWRYAGSPR